jgi:L-fuculose-phosphate aldolase
MTIYAERQAREDIIRIMRIVTNQGLVSSNDGNISVRLDENLFLITPSGLYKKSMEPDDLVIVDWQHNVVKGRPGLKPSSELSMHLEAFRQRDDIRAVVHAHPIYATALTIVGEPFPMDIIPETAIGLGYVPVAEYATPGTPEMATSIRDLLPKTKVIMLSHHGSLTLGYTLDEALIALERLEHTAHSYYVAKTFGEIIRLPADELDRLQALGRRVRGETID